MTEDIFVSMNGIMELQFITDNKIVRTGFQALVYQVPGIYTALIHKYSNTIIVLHIYINGRYLLMFFETECV